MSATLYRFSAADNHRRWAEREAFRITAGAIEVRELSVRDALSELNLSLDTAQKLLDWQRGERRQGERRNGERRA